MMLFCCVGFAQDKEVMVVRQTDGNEVRFDVTKVERVYVEPAPSAPTYTMRGNIRTFESRVTYEDVYNTIICRWEIGDNVKLKADGADENYAFVITSLDGTGVGTMAHQGAIPSADNFTGTATYAPRDAAKVGIQTENDHTGHLKYGETMVATLTGQKIDGASLVFSHPVTAVYKVTFTAPATFTAGSTLTMSGAWTADAVLTLGFGAAKDDIVIAYIMHTAGSLASGGQLKFSLAAKDGDTYSYTFTSTKVLTYSADKYWLANISGKEMEKEIQIPVPEAVDLGLPSGLKWASFNLGASKPEEYGDYYGWGCTKPYADGEDAYWPLYFSMIGGTGTEKTDCGTEKDPFRDYVYPNNKSIAGTEWDVASQKLGGTWRMPTKEEQKELKNTDNCNWQWTTENGVNGYKVTSKHNDNSIFLPAAGFRKGTSLYSAGSYGYFWSSSPNPDYRDNACLLYFLSRNYAWGSDSRYLGFPVRPVIE